MTAADTLSADAARITARKGSCSIGDLLSEHGMLDTTGGLDAATRVARLKREGDELARRALKLADLARQKWARASEAAEIAAELLAALTQATVDVMREDEEASGEVEGEMRDEWASAPGEER